MKIFPCLLKMEPGEPSKPEEELFSGNLVDLLFSKIFCRALGGSRGREEQVHKQIR